MQAYSGSHSIIWACTHRVWRKVAPLNVLLNKDNLIKAGITRGMISFGWSLLKFGFIWTSWQAFVCLPLELTHTHTRTHTVQFHTFTGWIINLELDLAPVRKSPRVQQCFNNNAAVTRQTDAARAPSRNEVSVAKTTLDEAEKFQGA